MIIMELALKIFFFFYHLNISEGDTRVFCSFLCHTSWVPFYLAQYSNLHTSTIRNSQVLNAHMSIHHHQKRNRKSNILIHFK